MELEMYGHKLYHDHGDRVHPKCPSLVKLSIKQVNEKL